MYEVKWLGLEEANVAIRAILEAAAKPNLYKPELAIEKSPPADAPVTVAVVDTRGDLIAFARQDGCRWGFANEMAIKKAYTSAKMRVNTGQMREFMDELHHPELATAVGIDVTDAAGGVHVTAPDGTGSYGGIGVCGRVYPGDGTLALIGLKALQDFVWPSQKED